MKHTYILMGLGFSLLITSLMMLGCTKEESIIPQDNQILESRGFSTVTGSSVNTNFFALSNKNELVRYKAGPPARLISSIQIVGLSNGEHMMAIDFRPSNGLLYGVTDMSMIYIIDPGSGMIKPMSQIPFEPAIKGSTVGFDFDPIVDQIRLVSDLDQNLRLDPDLGTVISVDNDLIPFEGAINAIAYSRLNNASRTYPLYDIDVATGNLFKQEPNSGKLNYVGSLGLAMKGEGGFDIGTNVTSGLAVLYGHSRLGGIVSGDNLLLDACRVYEINLLNGKTTYKGKLDRIIIGIAIQ